jgi:hypothetical protein
MLAGVDHVVYEQILKNLVEKINDYIKDRSEASDDLFPCRKPKFEHVKNWLKAFRFFYNYVLFRKLVQCHYQMISCLNGLSQFC